MDRATASKINNDKEIVGLRMQAEELINNQELLDKELFESESRRIKQELEQRFVILYEKYK
ncbi:hypothetical protein JGH11_04110 [Dysgonomonas sp. Marseille-P4677]|uniref:hypothetical protein n=1 Tax=Dysgonomonas sp. Marseille-P4677 TaxID=2364790 RepID=UPI00191458A8|nr:hypothetical protein [Dysgonomonas sp. Marseille-P4677]MBK5720049.1 hypothetical protein [Dysgonomonas sp. Marseille-P4677]